MRIDSRESPRFALRIAGPSKPQQAESGLKWLTIIPEKLHAQKNDLGINFQKCVMTFRVIDYTEKMFGELIAEELHRTLSHINCTPASVACFGELAGCKSELTCCATWVPKMHMANLGIFWVVWVPGAQKRWKT